MNDRIVIDPAIQHGKPVIRGTRVPIVRIIGGMAGGMSIAEISQEYGVSERSRRARGAGLCQRGYRSRRASLAPNFITALPVFLN